MCTNIHNDDNVDISDYDIQIGTNYYNHDYDEVDFNEQKEESPQTDVLFE